MNACYRGCRLYSICQFVNGNAGFNTSREECQGGESQRVGKNTTDASFNSGCLPDGVPETRRTTI